MRFVPPKYIIVRTVNTPEQKWDIFVTSDWIPPIISMVCTLDDVVGQLPHEWKQKELWGGCWSTYNVRDRNTNKLEHNCQNYTSSGGFLPFLCFECSVGSYDCYTHERKHEELWRQWWDHIRWQ
jgi:hypothetical protein